jgi:hypothetical protein
MPRPPKPEKDPAFYTMYASRKRGNRPIVEKLYAALSDLYHAVRDDQAHVDIALTHAWEALLEADDLGVGMPDENGR